MSIEVVLIITLSVFSAAFALGWWTSKMKHINDENRRRWEEIIERMRKE
jgi:hypothetical protein